jgi:hypothetical protein
MVRERVAEEVGAVHKALRGTTEREAARMRDALKRGIAAEQVCVYAPTSSKWCSGGWGGWGWEQLQHQGFWGVRCGAVEQAAREALHSAVGVKADSGALEALARNCDERAGAQAAALATLQQEVRRRWGATAQGLTAALPPQRIMHRAQVAALVTLQ